VFSVATELLCPIYFRSRPFPVLTFIFGNCGAKFWKIFRHEFETRSSPDSLGATLRAFAFYLGNPSSSIETRSFPSSLAATLAASPSMSLIPSAPFTNGHELLQREETTDDVDARKMTKSK
jgi:hypothetical protein